MAESRDIEDTMRAEEVAVGVSGGISILIHGTRLLLEYRRGMVVVRMDMRNVGSRMSQHSSGT